MILELLLATVTLVAAGFGVSRALRASRDARRWRALVWLIAGGGLALVALGAARRHPAPPERDIADRPIQVQPSDYVTSSTCRACHPGEYASWDDSYHSSMTQIASPDRVLGDFDGAVLRQGEWVFRLRREGDEFWIDMPDLDWSDGGATARRVQRKVVLTTGSHHMQAYWYASGNTRVLGLLPFVFNLKTQEWMPRDASFIQPPDGVPGSELGRWNKVCIECHVVQGRLRPVEPSGHDTMVAEFGIACESCHGPAGGHVTAYADPLRRYASRLGGAEAESIVQPEDLPHDRASEVCGQCHSTSVWTSQAAIDDWMVHGFAFRPGDRLADTRNVVRGQLERNTPDVQEVLLKYQSQMLADTYWGDGMNRVAGREYNGLLETPCFQRGEMSCLSCHEMHRDADDPRPPEVWADDQLRRGMRGNAACTQCHTDYDAAEPLAAHSHHAADSTGSVCYNCHMPHTTYGLLKAVRSHHLDSPSVAASLAAGRPNACNQCHLDRPLAWTAGHLEHWYGIPVPELGPEEREIADSVLGLLRGDAGRRALAAWTMGWEAALEVSGDDWQAPYLAVLLADPYPAVRLIARSSLSRLPGFEGRALDLMADEDDLQRQANAVIADWLRRRTADGRRGDAILIDERGGLQSDRLLTLAEGRDDRPVHFAE